MLFYSNFIKNINFRFTKNIIFCIIICENRFFTFTDFAIFAKLKGIEFGR